MNDKIFSNTFRVPKSDIDVHQLNENGVYEINLPEGVYTIKFEAAGHKSYIIKKYRISSYRNMKLDVVLDIIPAPII